MAIQNADWQDDGRRNEMDGVIERTQSRNGVPIRLTQERWRHILSRRPNMNDYLADILQTVADPDLIQEGDEGSLLAVRLCVNGPLSGKFIVVAYRETEPTDGFIITAHPAKKPVNRRRILWNRFGFL